MKQQVAPVGVWASFKYAFSSGPRATREIIAGLTVALALIPEAISFSVLAGVAPAVGLYSSAVMAIVIAFTGGRPAMITAATGAIALVIGPVSREYGMEYLLATVILGGVIQIVLSLMGVAKLMRFIPRSVMTGFVNALGITIFLAQVPHLIDVPWMVYVVAGVGLAIMIFLPKLTSAIPAPLVTVVFLTFVVWAMGTEVPDVSDQGELPDSLPGWIIPDVPYTWETLRIIFPYAFSMAVVGLMESLMTAKLVDDITDTHSDKTTEARGQGIANVLSGFFGGMGGCAMIGQTMINVKESHARTRLSSLSAGVFLLVLIVGLGDLVGLIPMGALVAIMVMVSVGTIDWHSVKPSTLRMMPKEENIVMFTTVIGTLLTENLAIGVGAGVIAAMVAFATRVAHLVRIEKVDSGKYKVHGQLFFASSNDMVYQFDYTDEADRVIVDMHDADVWDASTIAALDAVREKYAERNKTVEFVGLKGKTAKWVNNLSGKLDG
ncbi:SulP family inorganic anion transporter [Corynebacterium cystitidis]|uniref:Sulfate permease, SulP family n=1 Tax=Corynebacterium cystitidis DSM 20524 TaxID=1121357 RepID=A0A1H9QWJ7_9CORY|nr:SulP family inorganic anion transporter [Corynebacterium cystitidis]WJY81633.1 C4-dicarboxylic acid transporter DauA [Corynebacterium cystitidis DSM 20524]SER64800.1 sulfate permease, SulP family [Corynebacterium cystitidis DSM 20524]SNV85484.1 transporter [Corynebacterium cystitidis]